MNLYNDSGDTPDEEGVELPDEAAARGRAITIMRDLIAEDVRSGRDLVHLTLQICDDSGRDILRLVAQARITGLEDGAGDNGGAA